MYIPMIVVQKTPVAYGSKVIVKWFTSMVYLTYLGIRILNNNGIFSICAARFSLLGRAYPLEALIYRDHGN